MRILITIGVRSYMIIYIVKYGVPWSGKLLLYSCKLSQFFTEYRNSYFGRFVSLVGIFVPFRRLVRLSQRRLVARGIRAPGRVPVVRAVAVPGAC